TDRNPLGDAQSRPRGAQHLTRRSESERGCEVQLACDEADLEARLTACRPRFAHQPTGVLLGVLLKKVRGVPQDLCTLVEGSLGPTLLRRPASLHRLIDVLQIRDAR